MFRRRLLRHKEAPIFGRSAQDGSAQRIVDDIMSFAGVCRTIREEIMGMRMSRYNQPKISLGVAGAMHEEELIQKYARGSALCKVGSQVEEFPTDIRDLHGKRYYLQVARGRFVNLVTEPVNK